jgi:hypothetical protein
LEVIEIGTWRMIFSDSFQTRVRFASFFSDSKALIAETRIALYNKKSALHLTLVNLQTGERIEKRHLPDNPYEGDSGIAIRDRILLVNHIDWKSIEKCSLALVEFPTYQEIATVPFVIESDEPEKSAPADSRKGISDDREIFVYFYGQTLVCRSTKDLEILWTKRIDAPLGVQKIISPNENYIAAAIADTPFRDLQKESYISIYNGKTGAKIRRLPLCGTEGLALSLNGNLLAVVEIKNDKNKKEYVLIVHIYDVKSGRVLASLEHDRIKWQRHVFTKAVCNVYFTTDGQYLISSGMNTKVWKLSRN